MEFERLKAMDPAVLVAEFERFENNLFDDCGVESNPAHFDEDG